MFERFTERARHVVVLAQEEARTLGSEHLGSEHLLLGLLREEEGLAARVLASLDVTPVYVRAQIEVLKPAGEQVAAGAPLPVTDTAKRVLELALREALGLGHNFIGTEHILLGLVRESKGLGLRILLTAGHDSEKVRNEVIRLLSGHQRPTPTALRPEPDRYTLIVSRPALEWLAEIAGAQPHTHTESREVYETAMQVLRLHPRRRSA